MSSTAKITLARPSTVRKYTNLLVGDTATCRVSGGSGKITGFVEESGKLYLMLEDQLFEVAPYYHVESWRRVAKPAVGRVAGKYRWVCNFHMRDGSNDYEVYKAAVNAANMKFGDSDAVSITKTARDIHGNMLDEYGAVWILGSHLSRLQDFHMELEKLRREKEISEIPAKLTELANGYGITRITKAELNRLPAGEKYCMVYMSKRTFGFDYVECVKLASKTSGVLEWNEVADMNFDLCHQDMAMINEDGSFEPSHGNNVGMEDGYLFIETQLKYLCGVAE